MDPKATAKSKRSHTQHGKRAHLPPAAIAHKKKAAASAAASSTHRALPSNWDRYDDANDEADPNLGTKQPDDRGEPKPKSKGADFGYLIEQARSQPKDLGSHRSQAFSSLDDFSFDFMQGVSSMLSVRGKGLLSLCQNDNFIIDDDTTPGPEVPFLSMDLHALSAQLSRLKLSQRLFIEADLLPEELSEEKHTPTAASTKLEISEPADSNCVFNPEDFLSFPVPESDGQSARNPIFKANFGPAAERDKPHNLPRNSTTLEKSSKSSKQTERFGKSEVEEERISQVTGHAISSSEENKSARFEAATAEAELDMLLDSFSETCLSDFALVGLINESSARESSNFGSIDPQSGQSTSRDLDPSSNATSSIDDSIDELLASTSLCLDDRKQTAPQRKETFPENSSLGARPENAYASLEDSIDDLLAETCASLNQRNKGTASKAMDDFDSWLDTL